MQRWLFLTFVLAVGCSDDDRNKTTPDTELVEVPAAISNDRHVRILFEARGNANGFICTLDGQNSMCISPFEADVLDGEHTFAVAASLNANVDETPAMHAWRIDSVAPETTITSAPPTLDNSVAPQFTFTGSDPSTLRAAGSVTFECAVDEGAFTACTSPHTLNSADGIHSFQVRSKDEAGNVDPTPAIHGWTIDATAPDTMITTGPAAGATSGPSGSFAFSSPDATATFECQVDTGAFTACVTPFAFTLADGAHTFAVRAKDPVGIVDPSPATRMWTVDATPPPVSITATPAALTNVTTPVFSFTSTDATATFECQIDGVVTFAACTSPWTGPTVTDGSRTFRVRATDAFANTGTPATFTWVVDTAPPTVALSNPPAALSNDNTPSVSFTTGGGAVLTECRADAGTFAACTSPFTSAALGDGNHTLTVRATDGAGNPATATTAIFVVDTAPPSVTFTTLPSALSNDTTPTVAFTTAGAPTTIECRVDSGAFGACASPFTGSAGEGTHTIGVRVTDAATNSAIFTTASFVIDTTPPTVTITGQPLALSNDKNPQVVFTHTGMTPACRLDAGTPVACTSPHAFTNVGDGAHTITVSVVDGAGNPGSATTSSFTIDTVGPTVAFVEQAPAQWPVNYFDFTFTTGDATVVQCSIDGAAFTACGGTFTATVSYNIAHTVQVRGTDAAGNPTTITSSAWTPVAGQVLHYPWEQGSAQNTSLLRQRQSHSPNGPAAGVPTFVGGWAGSALGNTVAAHVYGKTNRALQSSPNGQYAVSFWIRAIDGASGTIFTTVGASGGLRATLAGGSQLTFTAFEGGQSQSVLAAISVDRWVHVGARTLGPGMPLEIFIDGGPRGTLGTFSGFNAGQSPNLTVGNWSIADVDDLRFYNVAFTNDQMCTVLARGFKNANGACVPLSPGFEIDFEGRVVDTGLWNLPLSAPQAGSFALTSHTLGQLFHLLTTFDWGFAVGGASFQANVNAAPARSFSFEFVPGAAFGRIVDWRIPCLVTGGGGLCGIMVTYPDNGQIQIYTGTLTEQKTTVVTIGLVANRFNNVVVTEQRAANGTTTSLTVFINNKATVIPIAGGDLYGRVNDSVRFAQTPNLFVDEYEFWATDLSKTAELLCENGLDAEFDVATGSCLLTYGP